MIVPERLSLVFLIVAVAAAASSSASDTPPEELADRIAVLPIPAVGESAESVRQASASILAEILAATSGEEQARLLAALRDRCFEALPWSDPLLLGSAEATVHARRSVRALEPEALVRDLLRLGFVHFHRGQLESARQFYEEAVAVARTDLGEDSVGFATALEALSYLLADQGDYRGALEVTDQALGILRRQTSPDVPAVIQSLNARATTFFHLQDWDAAASDWREALTLCQGLEVNRENELIRARIESNLGELYRNEGDLVRAQEHLEEARRLRAGGGAVKEPVRQLASTLLNLADVYYLIGDYPEAIQTLEEAVEAHRQWLGEDSNRLAEAFSMLATVLEESGRWDEALARQLQALTVRFSLLERGEEKGEGERLHRYRLDLGRSLARLGALQHRMGAAEARRSLSRALTLQEQELGGRPHSDLAWTLLALARLELDSGYASAARGHVERALAALTAIDHDHPLLVEASRLTALLSDDLEEGLRSVKEGQRLATRIYGDTSPHFADLLFAEAQLQQRGGASNAALAKAVRAYSISLEHVVEVIQAFPEDQALSFAADRRRFLDLALTLLRERGVRYLSGQEVDAAWEAAASGRSLVLDSQLIRQRMARARIDPQIGAEADRLIRARSRLAFLLVRAHRDRERGEREIERARAEVVDAERGLAHATSRYAHERSTPPVRLAEISAALPAGAALISIIQYRDAGGDPWYMAFVLDSPAGGVAVPLGPAELLDSSISAWRSSLLDDLRTHGDSTGADSESRALGHEVRRRIWDPLRPLLGEPRLVFMVPDGFLNLVNLGTLPISGGRYVLEEGWLFHTLTAERDLIERRDEGVENHGLLLVGDVDYRDRPSQSAALEPGLSRSAGPFDCQRSLPPFRRLPATLEEVREIAARWQSGPDQRERSSLVLLTGEAATEDRVRALAPRRKIVHLATHGFAAGYSCTMARTGTRGIGGLSIHPTGPAREDAPALAGVALAGANSHLSVSDAVDGLLLAEEVIDLDLRGVEWVVLSACDSGIGELQTGEGVTGLRRAFHLSGVRTLILSLWPVEDRATRDWMEQLYQARLIEGHTSARAVHEATLATLAARRAGGQSTSPGFWGAFVGVGDWR